ncbi:MULTISPECIES: hypothetical protein [unclassified Nocardia]|uniref:hypothetical protein n=1 Tax=unclassified Nocardia TaxID=2637762 RepID=UPI001CE3C7A5|nr:MULTISPECIES: hypothetical protein [unclassified Nocardia]
MAGWTPGTVGAQGLSEELRSRRLASGWVLRDHVAAPVQAVLESTRGRSVRRFDRDARAVDSRFAERLSSGWVVRQTDSIAAQSIRRVGSPGSRRAEFVMGAPFAGSSSSGDVLEDSAVARRLPDGGRGNGFDAPGGGVAGGFGRGMSGDETDSAAV